MHLRVAALLAGLASFAASAQTTNWLPLGDDGLHDPRGPGIRLLQDPQEALRNLPPDTAGNLVRWIPALREGVIQPREKLRPETEVRRFDKDIFLNLRGGMPAVRFPHKAHTEWLDCTNCHDHLFERKRGATKINMFLILQGQQCGVCHGAVAFPLTECGRCHSMPREKALEELAAQDAAEAEAARAAPAKPAIEPAGGTKPTSNGAGDQGRRSGGEVRRK